jgi:RHS repeat-associated protein
MLQMAHLPLMQWDYKDRLRATSRQVTRNHCQPEITYYVYDTAGQRVRKVTERQASTGKVAIRKAACIYIGACFQVLRKYLGDGHTVILERETVKIIDAQQKLALIETRTSDEVRTSLQTIQYQLVNHLGSTTLKLNQKGQISSHEEYFPYGSTSYQAKCRSAVVSGQYRYTGKERDEGSELYYHGARYYVPWIGRWTAMDPVLICNHAPPSPFSGATDSGYIYGINNPVKFTDPNGKQGVQVNWIYPNSESGEIIESESSNPRTPPYDPLSSDQGESKAGVQNSIEFPRHGTIAQPGGRGKPSPFSTVHRIPLVARPGTVGAVGISAMDAVGVANTYLGMIANMRIHGALQQRLYEFIDQATFQATPDKLFIGIIAKGLGTDIDLSVSHTDRYSGIIHPRPHVVVTVSEESLTRIMEWRQRNEAYVDRLQLRLDAKLGPGQQLPFQGNGSVVRDAQGREYTTDELRKFIDLQIETTKEMSREGDMPPMRPMIKLDVIDASRGWGARN